MKDWLALRKQTRPRVGRRILSESLPKLDDDVDGTPVNGNHRTLPNIEWRNALQGSLPNARP